MSEKKRIEITFGDEPVAERPTAASPPAQAEPPLAPTNVPKPDAVTEPEINHETPRKPKKLTEMVPQCIKLNCRKIASGRIYENEWGMRATDRGWPLPGDGETSLGRWNVMGARMIIDNDGDKPYVNEGSLGLLVTDKAIRGSFYEGWGAVGKLKQGNDILTFMWSYDQMNEPIESHYFDDRHNHLIIEDPEELGHLGLKEVTKPKSDRQDDFLSPVFSMKNRQEELFEQIAAARKAHLGRNA